MNLLKQSTAATIKLGAFVDDTDGKTAKTGLTISQADIRLSKNGGDFAQTNNSAGATHDEFGYYDIPLDTTDTGTLGRLRVAVSESGALPVWQDFLVVTANVYDTLCSTDTFDVNVTALADDVITAGKFDESTAFPLKSADTGLTQVARVGADSDTLETLSDEIAAVKAETAAILVDTGTTLDTKINTIDGIVDDILVDTSTTLDGKLNTIDTNVDSILADTGTDGVKLASTQGAITWGQQKIVADVDGEGALDIVNTGSGGGGVGIHTEGEFAGLQNMGTVGTINEGEEIGLANFGSYKAVYGFDSDQAREATLTAIKAKTDNLPADPADDSDIDAQLAAIKAETALIVEDTGTTIPATLANLALEATLTAMKGAGWTDETLVKIITDISNISAGSGATPQQVWEYASRTLTDPNSYKADVSTLATAADLQDVEDKIDVIATDTTTEIPATLATLATAAALDAVDNFIDTEVAAIKAKTDLIPASPAEAGEYTAAIAAVQADLDNPDQYKADVSSLAKATDLQDVEDKIDVIATDTTTEIPATLATLATSAALATVDTNVDSVLADTNEIQAELADGGRTDLLIDSIVGATTATGVLLKDTAIEAIFNDIVVTGSYTFAELMKIMASALAGELSGGGTTTLTFKSVDGASDVIEAIVDANGNRTSVTLTV